MDPARRRFRRYLFQPDQKSPVNAGAPGSDARYHQLPRANRHELRSDEQSEFGMNQLVVKRLRQASDLRGELVFLLQ
jgi:hypothetical protein